jgi:5-methylcytosine-specific restriction endonuclease McrA
MASRARREQQLITRDDGDYCFYCGAQFGQPDLLSSLPVQRTFDHIIPVSEGGTGRLDNSVLAYGPCNGNRGNKLFLDFCQSA